MNSQNGDVVADFSYEDYQLQWEKLTHSCLVIGYGFDIPAQKKYWIVRNSYGGDWGENGNFRITRGTNAFGGEGELAAIKPVYIPPQIL